MLDQHLKYIETNDQFYKSFISGLSSEDRIEFYAQCERINNFNISSNFSISTIHTEIHNITKRFFIKIPDIEFLYSKIPDNWNIFIREYKKKEELYELMYNEFNNFLTKYNFAENSRFYGNIKTDESLDQKIGFKKKGDSIQNNVLDLWDVVRFRIITPDILSLQEIGISLWEIYYDRILRCRNFYFFPKQGLFNDPYRGIHFEFSIEKETIVELQLLSKNREIVSVLDHALVLKKNIDFLSKEHEKWLMEFSMKSNILDALILLSNNNTGFADKYYNELILTSDVLPEIFVK